MLIEILGSSSSLLVVVLIGLSIYFGIQAKTRNIKWSLVFWIITKESNQEVWMPQKNQKLTYSYRCFLTFSRLRPLSRSILEIGIQLQFTNRVSIAATKIDNGKTSSIKECRMR